MAKPEIFDPSSDTHSVQPDTSRESSALPVLMLDRATRQASVTKDGITRHFLIRSPHITDILIRLGEGSGGHVPSSHLKTLDPQKYKKPYTSVGATIVDIRQKLPEIEITATTNSRTKAAYVMNAHVILHENEKNTKGVHIGKTIIPAEGRYRQMLDMLADTFGKGKVISRQQLLALYENGPAVSSALKYARNHLLPFGIALIRTHTSDHRGYKLTRIYPPQKESPTGDKKPRFRPNKNASKLEKPHPPRRSSMQESSSPSEKGKHTLADEYTQNRDIPTHTPFFRAQRDIVYVPLEVSQLGNVMVPENIYRQARRLATTFGHDGAVQLNLNDDEYQQLRHVLMEQGLRIQKHPDGGFYLARRLRKKSIHDTDSEE